MKLPKPYLVESLADDYHAVCFPPRACETLIENWMDDHNVPENDWGLDYDESYSALSRGIVVWFRCSEDYQLFNTAMILGEHYYD